MLTFPRGASCKPASLISRVTSCELDEVGVSEETVRRKSKINAVYDVHAMPNDDAQDHRRSPLAPMKTRTASNAHLIEERTNCAAIIRDVNI